MFKVQEQNKELIFATLPIAHSMSSKIPDLPLVFFFATLAQQKNAKNTFAFFALNLLVEADFELLRESLLLIVDFVFGFRVSKITCCNDYEFLSVNQFGGS